MKTMNNLNKTIPHKTGPLPFALCTLNFALILTLTAGCRNKEVEAFNNLEKDRFLVKTEKAQVRNLEEYILLTGSVKALDEATLYPRISGKLLKNLLKESDQ